MRPNNRVKAYADRWPHKVPVRVVNERQPASTADRTRGALIGISPGPRNGQLRSEYGAVSDTLYVAIKVYF
jgi:hypothetical protein